MLSGQVIFQQNLSYFVQVVRKNELCKFSLGHFVHFGKNFKRNFKVSKVGVRENLFLECEMMTGELGKIVQIGRGEGGVIIFLSFVVLCFTSLRAFWGWGYTSQAHVWCVCPFKLQKNVYDIICISSK